MKNLNKYIDHTILKQDATSGQIEKLCHEAIKYNFKSVCVNPYRVEQAYAIIKDSDVLVCTVIGFPLGATTTQMKCFEVKHAILQGTKEIDMVINVGAIKDNDWACVRQDVENVVRYAENFAKVKVILETCLLTDDEKIRASKVCQEAGAHFIKTSTGFSTGGATIKDIKLMREAVGEDMGVKASGGIRDYKTAIAMINAGATRIGTSSGIAIMSGSEY